MSIIPVCIVSKEYDVIVCGKKLSASVNPESASEETFRLSCGHEFHKVREAEPDNCLVFTL